MCTYGAASRYEVVPRLKMFTSVSSRSQLPWMKPPTALKLPKSASSYPRLVFATTEVVVNYLKPVTGCFACTHRKPHVIKSCCTLAAHMGATICLKTATVTLQVEATAHLLTIQA
ncbi:hypothetical protein Dimus_000405 [Dionaea muscipula]